MTNKQVVQAENHYLSHKKGFQSLLLSPRFSDYNNDLGTKLQLDSLGSNLNSILILFNQEP